MFHYPASARWQMIFASPASIIFVVLCCTLLSIVVDCCTLSFSKATIGCKLFRNFVFAVRLASPYLLRAESARQSE